MGAAEASLTPAVSRSNRAGCRWYQNPTGTFRRRRRGRAPTPRRPKWARGRNRTEASCFEPDHSGAELAMVSPPGPGGPVSGSGRSIDIRHSSDEHHRPRRDGAFAQQARTQRLQPVNTRRIWEVDRILEPDAVFHAVDLSMALPRDRHRTACVWQRKCRALRISVPVHLRPPVSWPRIQRSEPIQVPAPHRIGIGLTSATERR